MNVIKLTGINKIYRTNEIETQALENVNIEVEKIAYFQYNVVYTFYKPEGFGHMTTLYEGAFAKINLTLDVLEKRLTQAPFLHSRQRS